MNTRKKQRAAKKIETEKNCKKLSEMYDDVFPGYVSPEPPRPIPEFEREYDYPFGTTRMGSHPPRIWHPYKAKYHQLPYKFFKPTSLRLELVSINFREIEEKMSSKHEVIFTYSDGTKERNLINETEVEKIKNQYSAYIKNDEKSQPAVNLARTGKECKDPKKRSLNLSDMGEEIWEGIQPTQARRPIPFEEQCDYSSGTTRSCSNPGTDGICSNFFKPALLRQEESFQPDIELYKHKVAINCKRQK